MLMVSPSMILIALVAAWPIIYAIWLSLHQYSVRVAGPVALGRALDNYSTSAVGSRLVLGAVPHTFIFTVISVIARDGHRPGMALAMHAAFRGQGLLRTVVLVPWAVLTVVTAVMWRTIFDSPSASSTRSWAPDTVWLGQEPHALIIMILADIWKTAPFMALLLLAGLQVIPDDIYEAAKVDGATAWQRFARITLPLLKPAILVALIFRTLDALRIFDLPYVLTKGAMGTSTLSLIAQQTFAGQPALRRGLGDGDPRRSSS